MSPLPSAAAAALVLAGTSVAVADPCPCLAAPAQVFASSRTTSAPTLKLEPDAARWEPLPAGQIRFRVTLPDRAEARSPVTVRLHWADDRTTGVNNAFADRDNDFIQSALAR
jgi:hypothetical protein